LSRTFVPKFGGFPIVAPSDSEGAKVLVCVVVLVARLFGFRVAPLLGMKGGRGLYSRNVENEKALPRDSGFWMNHG
jgi:hypothetical protein